jgi:hypothetical protein
MARLLNCPHCHAEFGFDDWAKATSCPACGLRLSFFEASAQATPAAAPTSVVAPWSQEPATLQPDALQADVSAAPQGAAAARSASPSSDAACRGAGDSAEAWSAAATAVAVPPIAASPIAAPPVAAPPAVALAPVVAAFPAASRRHVYTIGGKALTWSTGWTVVLAIWAIVAVGLTATRVDMGRLTVVMPAENAAIAAVQKIRLPSGASTEAVLRYSATHKLTLEGHVATIPAGGTQMWYAFDRPWEHRIYVYSELPGASMIGKDAVLSWSVSSGVAAADGGTRAAVSKAAQIMAHPPSPNSVPAVPGIIPSLPPDLQ